MRSTATTGFSLIELMIVIGIIALLAGLLFPVFESARKAAQRNTCIVNQRQIAFTIQALADDNDGKMPSAKDVWSRLDIDNRILHCPNDPSSVPISYVYNGNLAGQIPGQPGWLASPMQVILIADGGGTNNIAVKRSDVTYRHANLAVAAYCDGHVQMVNFTDVCHSWVGNIQYKPVPFTGNTRYAASPDTQGTTVTCVGGPDNDWTQEMISDYISDVPSGSYCCLRFKYANPGKIFCLGITECPPYLSQGFTTDTFICDTNTSMVSFWEDPPQGFIKSLNINYHNTSDYAVERMPDGTVNYLVDNAIVYTSETKTTGELQFHLNAYNLGAKATGIRYVSEIE